MQNLLTTAPRRTARRDIDRLGPDFWVPSQLEYETYTPPPPPAMTTPFELCLFETFARDAYTGRGLIVDLGCWLGATTCCLARGLASNKRISEPPPIHAFDLFVWTMLMDEVAEGIGFEHNYFPGDSYYEDVQRYLGRYGEFVRLMKEHLIVYRPGAEPVEFLLVDAQKSWPLGHSITAGFFPLLIPNRSYVVQQDFCYHKLDEVQTRMIMWYLRDHFECIHHVPQSCGVVFRATKRIHRDALPAFRPALFDLDDIHRAYEYCYGCVGEADRAYLRIGKICHLVDWGYTESARSEAIQLASDGTPIYESSRQYALRYLDSDHAVAAQAGDGTDPSDREALGEIRAAISGAPAAGS
jgi:hypothetical protein